MTRLPKRIYSIIPGDERHAPVFDFNRPRLDILVKALTPISAKPAKGKEAPEIGIRPLSFSFVVFLKEK